MARTFIAAITVSGLALAAPAPPPSQGGVPHTDDGDPGPATASASVSVKSDADANRKTVTRYRDVPTRERTREMQRALAARNLYQGKVDGTWGRKTEAALRNFQTQQGLEVTGRLNAPTAEALGLEPQSERVPVSGSDAANPVVIDKSTQGRLEDSSTNVQLSTLNTDQAKEMQQRLQLLGYYRGPIDGQLGEGTRVALQRFFQHQAQLASRGVVSNAAISLFGTQPNEVKR